MAAVADNVIVLPEVVDVSEAGCTKKPVLNGIPKMLSALPSITYWGLFILFEYTAAAEAPNALRLAAELAMFIYDDASAKASSASFA